MGGRSYKQKDKSKMWNQLNKLKRIRHSGNAFGLGLPKGWLKELGIEFGDVVIISLNTTDKIISLRKVIDGEFVLPENPIIEVDDAE